jgi:hypothetical protein
MRVEYRWLDGASWLQPVIFLFYVLVVISVGTVYFLRGDALIPSLCVFPLFIFAYVMLAYNLNSTMLIIRPTELEIEHGPLPWFEDRVIAMDTVESLSYVEWPHEGIGRDYRFYCNRLNKKRCNIFFGVRISKTEPAIKALTKVIRWLEPYRCIAIINENANQD